MKNIAEGQYINKHFRKARLWDYAAVKDQLCKFESSNPLTLRITPVRLSHELVRALNLQVNMRQRKLSKIMI